MEWEEESKICKSITHNLEIASMRITSKGQVTIPQDIRERFGFLPHTEVEFVVENDRVVIRKVDAPGESLGERVIRLMSGAGSGDMSTDEIMRLTRGEDWNRS